MSYELPLSEYLRLHNLTQSELAHLLGLTQGRISQMIVEKRDVWIQVHADGAITSYEKRRIPRAAAMTA